MIEQRGLPFHGVVTLDTARHTGPGKLSSVHVLVTVLALRRSCLEVHVQQFRFKIRRLVAIDTWSGSMCAEQRKLRLRVVEPGEFFPGLGGVAGFASGW